MDENIWNQRKETAADWFKTVRDDLCARLESLEPDTEFGKAERTQDASA
mgnify:CR=1 FL=1